MDSMEATGKTVDEAVENACRQLNVSRDQVEVEILENANKGLFGLIGNKNARVCVTVKEQDPIEHAQQFLREIFANMGLMVEMTIDESEHFSRIELKGEKLGILIGKHGQTLDALQYLTNLAANKVSHTRVRIVLDVEDYRRRRRETLEHLALRMAERVRRRGDHVTLEPMNPQERKIIHVALQNMKDISTYSEGEDPYRKITIKLKR